MPRRCRVVAGAVTLAARPDLTLTLTAVEVEGRTDLVALLERVNPSAPGGWQLGVSPDGWITARRARGGLRLVVEPVVVDGRLTLELCGAGWRGRLLQLPRRLRVTRRLDLPHLGGGVSVSEAQRCGDVVEFRLLVPTVERCLDPGSLIEAVSRDRGRRP